MVIQITLGCLAFLNILGGIKNLNGSLCTKVFSKHPMIDHNYNIECIKGWTMMNSKI